MSTIEQVKDILVASNKEALTKIVDEVLFPELEKLVQASATPIDDVAYAALAPVIKAELKKIITHL